MKKIITLLSCVLMISVFVSCNWIGGQMEQGENTSDQATNDGTAQETTTAEMAEDDMKPVNGAYLKSLTALQYGSSESYEIGANHLQEIDFESNKFFDTTIDQEIEFTFEDQTYTLTYESSKCGPLSKDSVHYYEGKADGKTIEVGLDADTGECVELVRDPTVPSTDEERLTSEQQREIAYAFFCANTDDPEAYQLVNFGGEGIHTVAFDRYVGEIQTYERISVAVDAVGNIIRYRLVHVGDMKGIESIPDEVVEEVFEILEERAEYIYGNLNEGFTYTYKTAIDRLVRLDDGSLALECSIGAIITHPNGDQIGDGAWFIIPITEPTQ